jgi:DNA-binding NtrC family response regulator
MTQPRTILIVDDDDELREGLEVTLRTHGYRTLGAEDSREAQQLIDGQPIDLVILDMMMPHWGGFAVLEHCRGRPGAPPFIMITANQGEKHKAYAEQLGVLAYIRKPFALERLLESVARALGVAARPEEGGKRLAVRCRCAGCGARIKAPVELLGQTRPCPGCRAPLVIQPEPLEDEGPVLATEEGLRPPAPRRRVRDGDSLNNRL